MAGSVAAAMIAAATATPIPESGVAGQRSSIAALASAAVLATAPTSAPAAGAVPNIDACVARLDPQLDIGYDRIAARCPDLMKQLESGAWAPWMPRGWKEPGNDLSAGSLKEFRTLVDRESATREIDAANAPNIQTLRPILTALAGSRNETGWTRFKSWLRSVLERRDAPTDENWLSQMVSRVGVSQSVVRLVTYAALAAVVVLAAIIVVNELRMIGLLGRRRDLRRKRLPPSPHAAAATSWNDIEQSPLRDRPRLLLELIVRRLSDRGALPPSGALTVRELTRVAQLPDPDDRSRLAAVALASERVRYSSVDAQLDAPIASGRELLERLESR